MRPPKFCCTVLLFMQVVLLMDHARQVGQVASSVCGCHAMRWQKGLAYVVRPPLGHSLHAPPLSGTVLEQLYLASQHTCVQTRCLSCYPHTGLVDAHHQQPHTWPSQTHTCAAAGGADWWLCSREAAAGTVLDGEGPPRTVALCCCMQC
jgi:hypothetical protein